MITDVKNVFCFGDEHASAVRAGSQSWVRQLEDMYYQADAAPGETASHHPVLYQMGIHGETAEKLAGHIDADLQPRLADRYRGRLPTLSVVSLGYADARQAANRPTMRHNRAFARSVGYIVHALTRTDGRYDPALRRLLYVGLPGVAQAADGQPGAEAFDASLRTFEAIACDVVTQAGGHALPLFDAAGGVFRGHDWVREQAAPLFAAMLAPQNTTPRLTSLR